MKTFEIVTDSSNRKYKKYNDTCYYENTPESLIYTLDALRENGRNVKVYLGDRETGKVWNEEHDRMGHIGRSTGSIKIPLICHPLSYGGPALLSDSVLKVMAIDNKSVLWQNDKFIKPEVTIKYRPLNKYKWQVYIDGELYGKCKTERQAKLLRTKMS